jgi:uncharacterized protein
MKVILAGGSGLIGTALVKELLGRKHDLILLTRRNLPENSRLPYKVVQWNPASENWMQFVDGADVVINLAGASIGAGRWTDSRKKEILESRTLTTRAIVNAISKSKTKPRVLINASAVGFYGNVPEGDVTEDHPMGEGFLPDVCEKWEAEALKVKQYGVRIVLLRTGIVLDRNGGALQKLLLPFRLFAGGPVGSGDQWFPWIHLKDEISAIIFALENQSINGPVNLSVPQSVRMKEFCRTLGRVMHRPSWLSVPPVILKTMLGEMAQPLLLDGQKVIPQKLLDAEFRFEFPNLEAALKDILHQ